MEFERTISLAALEKGAVSLTFEADEKERRALAGRFGLLHLAAFAGEVRAVAEKGGAGVTVDGRIRARLSQACGVTLEPVEDNIARTFHVRFVAGPDVEMELDPECDDDVEPLVGDEIDVGEIAAQYLSIALNPYPRKKGSDASDLDFKAGRLVSEEEARIAANPFSLLKKLGDRN